jgi:hypothetical protein
LLHTDHTTFCIFWHDSALVKHTAHFGINALLPVDTSCYISTATSILPHLNPSFDCSPGQSASNYFLSFTAFLTFSPYAFLTYDVYVWLSIHISDMHIFGVSGLFLFIVTCVLLLQYSSVLLLVSSNHIAFSQLIHIQCIL